ncbi:hypothetical protein TUMSATVNIG1_22930 [Vibrio nigripulchritudo]|nr:hypothetical protein VNTUMSATTG_22690 [Vibrio nigripulchritudo]BDU31684.1 hypothetical protein TUMSATVNIG1_22930 [Vibrio nigripulchritudo]
MVEGVVGKVGCVVGEVDGGFVDDEVSELLLQPDAITARVATTAMVIRERLNLINLYLKRLDEIILLGSSQFP